jgi:hypothetical protein
LFACKNPEAEKLPVKGVQFVSDSEGRKVAVLPDLEEWGELREDIYDNVVADERAGESSSRLGDFENE